MTTTYPTSVDSFTNPTSGDQLTSPSHAAQHANANDAIEAIETNLLAAPTAFTPTWTNHGTATFTTNIGRYFRHGRMVHILINMTVNAVGTGGGTLRFAIPLATSTSLNRQMLPGYIDNWTGLAGGITPDQQAIYAIINPASSPEIETIRTAAGEPLLRSHFAAGCFFFIQGWYELD
jgi:peroxiredoxin